MASGANLTCTTTFTHATLSLIYITTLGSIPRCTQRWKRYPHLFHAHLALIPKYRQRVFTDTILTGCEESCARSARTSAGELREFNGENDHVHLLVHHLPSVALSRLVGSLKGVSARRLRQDFHTHINKYLWGEHLWSPSGFAGPCGGAPLTAVSTLAGSRTDALGADGHDAASAVTARFRLAFGTGAVLLVTTSVLALVILRRERTQ
ncbi:IS200/IS605 family transposase [Streptomyces sp. PA03-6a]|nr:IS200/IS605 family transposase [Streptomyces sp. PA03-6a]